MTSQGCGKQEVLEQRPQGKGLQRQVWGDFEESLVDGHLQMSSRCVYVSEEGLSYHSMAVNRHHVQDSL